MFCYKQLLLFSRLFLLILNVQLVFGENLNIVLRDEWIAQPPSQELDDLNLPVSRVIIAHTATEGCDSQANCVFSTRLIQTFHMESRNFHDIGYNFLVGGDGNIYEGRGWNKMGAHTKGYNTDSIGIAFIGTFTNESPNEKQLNAAKQIIEEGVKLNKIASEYKLYGHRQFIPTESPGEELFNIIKQWPHFSEDLKIVLRDEWLAMSPSKELDDLNLPVSRVIIAHTATKSCNTLPICVSITRNIQKFHMESRAFGDIAYNFLVGGDGNIYEGRGWNKVGAHTKGNNKDSIGIAFIGTFTNESPNEKQLNAAKQIIEEGVKLNKIATEYKLFGHRQFAPTESPGEKLYNIIEQWPHFSVNDENPYLIKN